MIHKCREIFFFSIHKLRYQAIISASLKRDKVVLKYIIFENVKNVSTKTPSREGSKLIK